MVVGILIVFDICKCVLLTFFSFIALYAVSALSPDLLSMVMFFPFEIFLVSTTVGYLGSCNYTHMSDSFKLISLNVRGISNFQKRRMIFTWCRKKSADIIFLQETHSKKETELQWKSEWGSEIMLSHGSSNSRGVAILLKRGVDCSIRSKILDPLGRFIILKTEIADTIPVH